MDLGEVSLLNFSQFLVTICWIMCDRPACGKPVEEHGERVTGERATGKVPLPVGEGFGVREFDLGFLT